MGDLSILEITIPTIIILVTLQLPNKTVAKIALYRFKGVRDRKERNSKFFFQNV